MAEEQQAGQLAETLRLLAQVVAAQERHTAEQERMQQQHLEAAQRSLSLAEKNALLYEKAIEQQIASSQRSEKRYQERLADQKRQQRWALVTLAALLIGLLLAVSLTHSGNKTKAAALSPSQNRVLSAD